MKKLSFKIISIIMGIVLILSVCVGCGDSKNSLEESQVELWGAPYVYKVLQDKGVSEEDKSYYDDIKTEAKIDVLMAKGEVEGAQFIITPTENVPYYNVEATELTHVNGKDKIVKENINVYKQMYLPLTVKFSRNDAPTGMYPDAILPFHAAVAYEENKIDKNTNQGIYITYQTTQNQMPGIYNGSILVDFESFTRTVPVSVEVVNVAVSEVNRAKSCMLTRWAFQSGELNSTQEMIEGYTDALVDYRLAPMQIVAEDDHSPEGIKFFVEKAYEYMQDPKFSNLSLPYEQTEGIYDGNGKTYSCIKAETMEKYLYAIAEKSFENNFDMFAKVMFYNAIIDEPTSNSAVYLEQVNLNCQIFNRTIKKVADDLEADATKTCDKKAEIIESLRNLAQVVTSEYQEQWAYNAETNTEEYINTFCPVTDRLNSESQRDRYLGQNERWWYCANNPAWPYPNYQVEYEHNFTQRLMGWMQAEYDITGVLYWSVNDYVQIDPVNNTVVNVEDYYGENALRSPKNSHMEGILFYPGGQYGLSKPVGSLRLESIRDGLEEYELLLTLKEKYAQAGFDADQVISSLSNLLYIGTVISATEDTFMEARETLLQLCSAVASPANMCVLEAKDNGDGSISNKVYVKGDYVLKNNGVALTDKVAHNDGYIYTIKTTLTDGANYLNLSFEADGVTYTYSQNLGGPIKVIGADKLVGGFSKDLAGVNASLENEKVRLDVQEVPIEVWKYQMFKFNISELKNIGEKTLKILFNVYNPNDEEIDLTIYTTNERNADRTQRVMASLKPKATTEVYVDVSSIFWGRYGNLNGIYFRLGQTKNEPAKTIYVENMVVYDK